MMTLFKLQCIRRSCLWLCQRCSLLGCGALGFILCFVFLSFLLVATPLQRSIEQVTGLNVLFLLRGQVAPPEDVVLLTMNHQVADTLGYPKQPIRWSREVYGKVVEQLRLLGAKLIVFDVFFHESRPEEDALFAKAMRDHGSVILFKYLKRRQISANPNSAFVDIEEELDPSRVLRESALGVANFVLPKYPSQVVSTHVLADFSQGVEFSQPLLAFLHYRQDLLPRVKGIIRAVDHQGIYGSLSSIDSLPEYALSLSKIASIDKAFAERILYESRISLGDQGSGDQGGNRILKHLFELLVDRTALYIHYYGPSESIKSLPLTVLLEDVSNTGAVSQRLSQVFKDKVVYIGFAELGLTEQQDAYRTVFSQANGIHVSGVEISATVFSNMLQGNSITPLFFGWALGIVLLFVIVPMVLFFLLPCGWALALDAAGYCFYIWWAYTLFVEKLLWLPLLTPLILMILATIMALYLKYSTSYQRQKNIQAALAHYLPEDIALSMSYNIDKLEQQHSLVQGICLMTDIHGYSRLSENLSPSELHGRLNEYYAKLISIVNRYGGSVSNIVGDSLLAIWTSDQVDEALCRKAVNAAHDMMTVLDSKDDVKNNLPTSVALHCGEFSLGHLGAGDHFEFSPVGDIVNTTSRIENLNRQLNTHILCSEDFMRFLNAEEVLFRGDFDVHNKDIAVNVYEVLSACK